MSLFRVFLLTALLFVAGALTVSAQSVIFNAPSTDIQAEKTFFLELDFIARFDAYRNGGFQSYGYRTVYGVRKKLEVGVNFFYTRNGSTSPKEFSGNVKYKVYEKEKYGFAAATGSQLYIPLNRAAGKRAYTMLYANASKIIPRVRGLRLTGGAYTVLGEKRETFGTKTGAMIGIEQPIFKRLTFTGDWFSGENRFGYAAVGLSYSVTKKQFVQAGYNFGNVGRRNNFFSAFYGLTF
jgi:hypothetical protein